MSFQVYPNLPATVVQTGNQISVNSLNALASADSPTSANPFVTVSYFNSHGGGGGGGGGASWGSISGSIGSQTDLQNQFGNYLALTGVTNQTANTYLQFNDGSGYFVDINPYGFASTNGNLITQNQIAINSAGITYPDGTVQTTAPAGSFGGGPIGQAITIANGTTDSYFGPDLFGIELTNSNQNSILQYGGLTTTDGTNSASVGPNSINTNDGTNASYVTPSSISVNSGSYYTQLTPYYFYATNGSGSMYYTPTYIQYSDGTTQTTAPVNGLDETGIFYAGICAGMMNNTTGWNYYASPMQFSIVYPNAVANAIMSGNVGITPDGINFYAFDTNGGGWFGASTYSGYGYPMYLAYKDGAGIWHQCPMNFA